MPHIKSKIVDKIFHKSAGLASSAVSNLFPSTRRANKRARQADVDLRILKENRAQGRAEGFKGGRITRAGKVRILARDVRFRSKRGK